MTDVIIIGGGPAGSVLGCYLSKMGISNTIIEKVMHPRPHIGESLVSSTVRIFDELDFLPIMEEQDFVRKYGAAWHPTQGRGEFYIEFAEFPQEGVNQDYTYHVDRATFDHLLLQHARKLGSKVIQGVGVKEVLFDKDDFARGVVVDIDGVTAELDAKYVADCSGRGTVLGNQRRLREKDPLFNQFAVTAHFENVVRSHDPKTADYIHIYFLPVERGWAWQIPIDEKTTSIGVVTEKSVFQESRQRKEEWFYEHIATTPDLAKAMENAKQVDEFNTEADYSYAMREFVGNGWLLVGDSARFVDPIFSSGISIAAESAKYAALQIQESIESGDRSTAALKPYETKIKTGVSIWYEFIKLYYKLMHLFTYFIQSKEHRLQILQLLQGEVYDREKAPVLDAMRDIIHTVENTPGHLWKPHLTNIPID
ncbi:MAG TPA: NAD(P)/FAD-dependent oxidoreductase [Acidimicrobiia bacterium]|nr:NAD(P)/FAD-dependent oxidoreductase [Acidimicrobiia bacterium]